MKVSLKSLAVGYFVVSALFVLAALVELFSAHRNRSLTAFLMGAFFAFVGAARLKSSRTRQSIAQEARSP